MKLLLLSVLLLPLLITGCATSPLNPPTAAAGPTDYLTMAAGGALGGAVGNKLLPGGLGAGLGTGVGILGTAVIDEQVKKAQARQEAEAYERGKRDARREILEQYWYENTTEYQASANQSNDPNAPIRPSRDIQYESQVRDGIYDDNQHHTVPAGPYPADSHDPTTYPEASR